ncbi:S9 family peptidase [Sphingobacterium alkalisoli]|uniref:S9 family peptidase n=1 Tax=Sphingobacterium alkalisoli TaxID=1874115 RepID=A0A4U0H9X5_9SPHI|nr:prolyl oligopeptidase family serine peptidase [Sphingobacterium alkalisoli]TJY68733.1 S9 family peptidase [Sphingobacterium alkalisoli]
MNIKTLLFLCFQVAGLATYAQENKIPISWKDIPSWSYIRMNSVQYTNDGKWTAFVSGPTQGDLSLTLRKTLDTTTYNYKIGGEVNPFEFNYNSKYIAFFESPNYKDIKANEKAKKPISKKLKIVSLSDTTSTVFDNVQSIQFSNEDSKWIAIRFSKTTSRPAGQPSSESGKGSDLLLYHLENKKSFNLGNVSDFKFNKSGQYIAYTVDADGTNGNGILLLDLKTGLTSILQNDKANYSKINWNKEGTAFALLKSKKDKNYKEPIYTLIGVKNIKGGQNDLFTYTGLDEDQITSGYGISQNSIPYWSKDLSTIFFGIAKIEKAENEKSGEAKIDSVAKDSTNQKIDLAKDTLRSDSTAVQIAGERPKKQNGDNKKDLEKPDMIIWNWQDKRLQSSQRNQLESDKNYMVMSSLYVNENRFISLADSNIRSIVLSPTQQIGYGLDFKPYEFESNLNGQVYADLYIIDVKTGSRKLGVEKLYLNATGSIKFSPSADYLLYYHDGNYYTLHIATSVKTNITDKIPTTFIDAFDDHNVSKPATSNFGWTQDGKHVLLKDNYDLWKVSADGKTYSSLTSNWKNQKLTTSRYNKIYEDDDFIDLKKDQYFTLFDDNTKQSGIALLAANKHSLEVLSLADVSFGLFNKSKHGDQFFYSKEKSNESPEIFTSTDKFLKSEVKLTSNTPDMENFAFSSGSKLLSYVNDFGDTLQATLFLPADYVAGKSYPTITYIYERLTDGTNSYSNPAFPGGGFNRAVYNSNGYAVLMPDITYKLNDPGMSAVACVVPAVKAAIATGIVDPDKVGLQGHSWGGYQTSFLITQTDIFKAAVAGAPLTNMISMYSLIYWNSGSTNQSIFESSQGRLTSGYWDNWDAFARNSPIYHIKKVNTPLVIMHNDKDGAVDYTQGIEYFNGLRRLNKPVVMLTYNGENHGLRKEVNQKDYAVRMMEFFDHYLKATESPDWWSKGIDYIDLPKHLEERAF